MTAPRFKTPPARDKAHLAHIRTLPCCLCNHPPPSEAAHIRFGHVAGTGQKPSDHLTLPLCRAHHLVETKMGPPLFWKTRLSTDNVLAARAMHALALSLVKA